VPLTSGHSCRLEVSAPSTMTTRTTKEPEARCDPGPRGAVSAGDEQIEDRGPGKRQARENAADHALRLLRVFLEAATVAAARCLQVSSGCRSWSGHSHVPRSRRTT